MEVVDSSREEGSQSGGVGDCQRSSPFLVGCAKCPTNLDKLSRMSDEVEKEARRKTHNAINHTL